MRQTVLEIVWPVSVILQKMAKKVALNVLLCGL